MFRLFIGKHAEVVELVDALRSGRSGRKPMGVRIPPSALGIGDWKVDIGDR